MANRRPVSVITGRVKQLATGDGVDAGVKVTVQSPTNAATSIFDGKDDQGTTVFQIFVTRPTLENLFMGAVTPNGTMTGVRNLFISVSDDASTGADLTSGINNLGIGTEAGRDLTSGSNNMLFGAFAGRLINTGSTNACIGFESGDAITSGSNNVCIGASAGSALTTTSFNVFIGANSGLLCTGEQNIAIGVNAMNPATDCDFCTAIGVDALGGLTTGADENTGIGIRAGNSVTTGTGNTFIGTDAGNNASQLATAVSSMALGHDSFTTASNQVVVGGANITNTLLRGSVAGGGVEIINSTTAQAFRVYNTFTSSTSYERLSVSWDTNVAEIQTEKGSGGGTARDLVLGTDATARITIKADGDILLHGLPTADPVVADQLWNDAGTVKISAG